MRKNKFKIVGDSNKDNTFLCPCCDIMQDSKRGKAFHSSKLKNAPVVKICEKCSHLKGNTVLEKQKIFLKAMSMVLEIDVIYEKLEKAHLKLETFLANNQAE